MGGTGTTCGTQAGGGPSLNQAPPAQTTGNQTVIPLEREKMQVGKQQVNNGALRVCKTVKTETVTMPVDIRQETVTVDRLPPNAGQTPPQGNAPGTALNQPFQGGQITIPLTKEQPVVQTQVVPAGSVVINKQETTQPVNVQGQVRSEDVLTQRVGIEAAGAAPPPSGQSSGAGSSQSSTQMGDQ
jgi:uncharacterized protein (TIGR02271 family)